MHSSLQQLHYLPLQTTMPLMNPQYPPQYYQKFTLLKKHIQLKLYTPEANQLAQQLIPFGQTNYNCWYVKKMCYLQGVVSCQHEIEFSQRTLYEKIKNFQLWEHRRFLIERNPECLDGEYGLIDRVLEIEPKNYHAWSHRTWVVEQVKNFVEELEQMRRLVEKDPYNNSVWAFRSFLVKRIVEGESGQENKKKIVDMEIGYCLVWLYKQLNNLSAWNYLRGYIPSIKLKSLPCTNSHTAIAPTSPSTITTILTFLNTQLSHLQKTSKQENFKLTNYHLEAEIQLLIVLVCLYSQDQGMAEYAKNTCLVLAEKDQQKRHYWKWVGANL